MALVSATEAYIFAHRDDVVVTSATDR